MRKSLLYTVLLVFLVAVVPQHCNATAWTPVERKFLAENSRQENYPSEHAAVIETRNNYELGKLLALRFIEWLKDNPNGVVSLSSGVTTEYFIKFLNYYKNNWHTQAVRDELADVGIKLKNFPATENLKLVQYEEYYPMSNKNPQKVSNYISRHYLKILGLKKENIYLIDLNNTGILKRKGLKLVFMSGKVDLNVLKQKANSQLEVWQQQALRELNDYCVKYEEKIRDLGGIDFFVGSVSYGGNLGFIKSNTKLDSPTHFVSLNYNTAAHAAKDLGGIEHARGKVGITVGLGTITMKPNATIIIVAAGESKSMAVRDAIEGKKTIKNPSSIVQKLPNGRFYLDSGAAKLLTDRRVEDIRNRTKKGWPAKYTREVLIEIALKERKEILKLESADVKKYATGRLLMENPPMPLQAMLQDAYDNLVASIKNGMKLHQTNAKKILHTGPHHDDIMLGYYPLIEKLIKNYDNDILYFTSGFNSVPDGYILKSINRASEWWIDKEKDNLLGRRRDKTYSEFRQLFAKQDQEGLNMLDTTLLLKNMVKVYELKSVEDLKKTLRWLKDDYFPAKAAGVIVESQEMLTLKGMVRESEAERLWTLKDINTKKIHHFRANFYNQKELLKNPRLNSDVLPFVKIYNEVKPDIITVADDPQSAPPVTHYKTLQIIAQALRTKEISQNTNLQIWGYRNIWFRYQISEANTYIPVTEQMLQAQKLAFLSCFNTQKSASFPSPFFEGNFGELTYKLQKEQLQEFKTLLGDEFFSKSDIPDLKNATGMIMLNRMSLEELMRRGEDITRVAKLDESFASIKD